MELKSDYFTFENSTFEAITAHEPMTLVECIAMICRILDDVVLPRLADLESRHPPRQPLWATQKATYKAGDGK